MTTWRSVMAKWFGVCMGYGVARIAIGEWEYILSFAINAALCWFWVRPLQTDDEWVKQEESR